MGRSSAGRAGGRANEGGSAYRAGLAAYIAAHGLADVQVGGGDDAPGLPVSLWFETTGPVDDIRCRFSARQRWDIQAKRTCTFGTVFNATVKQWVAEVRSDNLGASDRIVLASGNLSEPLRLLGAAFRRLRNVEASPLLPMEERSLELFRELAVKQKWKDVFDSVVAHALIICVAAETELDSAFREVAAILDGTVVERGSGAAAIHALTRFFQTEAARAGASSPERWLQVLDDAQIKPGPGSVSASAGRTRALADYRRSLTRRTDLLNVDHFAMGVPPMPVAQLMNTFNVELPRASDSDQPKTFSIERLARRWTRLAIVGLPGSGKSTALEQLAATWAADHDAPLPILVRLHRLIPELRAGQVDLPAVVALGDGVRDELVGVLVERLRTGSAALVLDGLDECRDQQGHAATAIRGFAQELHAESGLVVSTREAASKAAGATGLPLTVLTEPNHLGSRVIELVTHVYRATRAGAPAHELDAALRWVADSQSAHPDIWQIPLFAVLLTVHIAQAPADQLPNTRAAALVAAVRDSVKRWEQSKADDPGAWRPELHPDLLLDGFATIGHEVVTRDTDMEAATAAIAVAAMDGWGLAKNAAHATASDVLRWWVDRVGTFTVTDGMLRARVRLMAEIGDAMWAAGQPPKARAAWIQVVVADVERYREPALLASALEPTVAQELIATTMKAPVVLLAADAVLQGSTPDGPSLATLLTNLIRLAGDPRLPAQTTSTSDSPTDYFGGDGQDSPHRHDAPAWQYYLALARLPLPPSLRPARDDTLAGIDDAERSLILKSLAIANDCGRDARAPLDEERVTLDALLALPVAQKRSVVHRRSRRHMSFTTGEPIVSGRADAALVAIKFVGVTHHNAAALGSLAKRVHIRVAQALLTAIEEAGFRDVVRDAYPFQLLQQTFRHVANDEYRQDQFILEAAAEAVTDGSKQGEPSRPWRLTGAAAIFGLLRLDKQPVGSTTDAVQRAPELVRHLVRLAVAVSQFPPEVVASDARLALELLAAAPLDTVLLLYAPPDPVRTSAAAGLNLADDDLPVLRSCLVSGNDWLFSTAAQWLTRTGGPTAVALLWAALAEAAPRHRCRLARWLIDFGGRNVFGDWLHADDPLLRVTAAGALVLSAQSHELVLGLVADNDLTVRLATLRRLHGEDPALFQEATTRVADEPPTVWTCTWCGSVESMLAWDCTACTSGNRPDLDEEIRVLVQRLPTDG